MKQPECDREAQRLLALQTNGKGTRVDFSLCVLFVGVIAVLSLLFWFLPDREMSENENRTLAQAPEFSLSSIVSGQFMSEFPEYMSDQFPGRDFFVTLKAVSETVLCRGGNNGVMFAADHTLISRDDHPNTDTLRTNLADYACFAAWCAERGVPATAAIAGRNVDVLDDRLLSVYGSEYSDRLFDTLAEAMQAENLTWLNLRDPLRARAQAGEYVYYRTDHHWTTLGAYYAYAEIADLLELTPFSREDFTPETVSDAFYGTTWSTAGAAWIPPDTMEYYRYADDMGYTVTVVDDGTSFAGFYDTSYLAKKDQYSSFISGNHGLVTVTKNGEEDRPTLLLLKDSFAHSVVPFLARHYNLVILDLRYYRMTPSALVTEYDVDQVLMLYNVDSLTSSRINALLRAGLE